MINHTLAVSKTDKYFYYWRSNRIIYYGASSNMGYGDNTLSTIFKSYVKNLYEERY